MFNIGTPELIIILVVALIILGPRRLPELARSLGRSLREFQKAAEDVKDSLTRDLREDQDQNDILGPGIEAAPPVEPPAEPASEPAAGPVPEPTSEPAAGPVPEPTEAQAPGAVAQPRE